MIKSIVALAAFFLAVNAAHGPKPAPTCWKQVFDTQTLWVDTVTASTSTAETELGYLSHLTVEQCEAICDALPGTCGGVQYFDCPPYGNYCDIMTVEEVAATPAGVVTHPVESEFFGYAYARVECDPKSKPKPAPAK